MVIMSRVRATAAARYPAQCVMLPTMPGGHCGTPPLPGQDWRRDHAELAKRASCAVPAGREFAAALVHGPGHDHSLFWEQRILGLIPERLSRRHRGGQYFLDQRDGTPTLGS
jgi:hypothetical protein